METSVITINQLTRRFKETVAVNNLSLEVRTGEIFGFLGHNGAGKTTTIKLLLGLARPTGGWFSARPCMTSNERALPSAIASATWPRTRASTST